MTVSLMYQGTLSRVRITADGMGAAVSATVERTINGVTYTTVRGGVSAVVASGSLSFPVDDYEFNDGVSNTYRVTSNLGLVQTAAITPALDRVWIKSITRPFMNRGFLRALPVSTVQRADRNGYFEVVGRTLEVVVSDVKGGRQYTLQVVTETKQEADDLDFLLASGDFLFVHTPVGEINVVGMYCTAGQPQTGIVIASQWRVHEIPLRECAAPTADVVGSTATYLTVQSTYATYNAVLAAKATYNDLRDLVGSPSEIIVA